MTNEMKRPELGSWHTITEHAIKRHPGNKVLWVGIPIKHSDFRHNPPTITTEYNAMYIGYRFKFNGSHESGQWDDEPYEYFSQSESVEVWMFVTHENRNPIPVFPFEVKQK